MIELSHGLSHHQNVQRTFSHPVRRSEINRLVERVNREGCYTHGSTRRQSDISALFSDGGTDVFLPIDEEKVGDEKIEK